MPTDIPKLFTSLGLSETETNVYLASLTLGPTSVLEIAKKSKLSRTATYDAVASLQKRGLLSTFERGKKTYFAAEDPERAVAYFKGAVHEMEEQLQLLHRVVPEIKMMAGGERPTVRFYEGDEALPALFGDVGQAHPKEVDELSNMDDVYNFLDVKHLLKVRETIDPKKLRMRILHRGELRNPREAVNFRRLPNDIKLFHGDIWIYGNRVAFLTFFGKIVVVIIESEPFADTARALFETAWRVSQK